MVSVFIIDDHPIVTKGLQQSLESTGSIRVSGIAHTAKLALEQLSEVLTQVVLLDLKLPDGNGIELSKEIFKRFPEIKIVVLTSFNQRYYIKAMVQNGVQGYLLKNSPPEAVIDAIFAVIDGENYFCTEVKELLKEQEPTIYLSTRELEVLKLIANGLTNQEISEKLFLSPLTVDSHRKNLIIKLGAKNTASLISIANNDGYL